MFQPVIEPARWESTRDAIEACAQQPRVEFSIRRVTDPSDPALEKFCEVYAEAFREPPYEESFPMQWIEEQVWNPHIPYLLVVAEINNEVVALGCAHPLSAPELSSSAKTYLEGQDNLPFNPESSIYISELAVRKDKRRLGVGAAITNATLTWGREQGFTDFVLRTAAEGSKSIKLYQSFGAEIFGPRQPVETTEGGISSTGSKERVYLCGPLSQSSNSSTFRISLK